MDYGRILTDIIAFFLIVLSIFLYLILAKLVNLYHRYLDVKETHGYKSYFEYIRYNWD